MGASSGVRRPRNSALRSRRSVRRARCKVEGDREIQVLPHHQLRLTELDLARDLRELTTVFVHDDDAHFVRTFGFEPIELQHNREVDAQRRGELFAVAASDPTRCNKEEAFAHLGEVGEHGSGHVHRSASVGERNPSGADGRPLVHVPVSGRRIGQC